MKQDKTESKQRRPLRAFIPLRHEHGGFHGNLGLIEWIECEPFIKAPGAGEVVSQVSLGKQHRPTDEQLLAMSDEQLLALEANSRKIQKFPIGIPLSGGGVAPGEVSVGPMEFTHPWPPVDITAKELGRQLNARRKKKYSADKWAADLGGVSPSTIHRIENGIVPRKKLAEKIAALLQWPEYIDLTDKVRRPRKTRQRRRTARRKRNENGMNTGL